MVVKIIRTTGFRLTEEHFGSVFMYRPSSRFISAWNGLVNIWKSRGSGKENNYLPYSSIATALRVLSGDFVAFHRRLKDGQAFLLSRKKISHEQLEIVLGAWEKRVLKVDNAPISSVLDELTIESVDVSKLVTKRPGLAPTLDIKYGNWPWDVAVWEVAHRLASGSMRTDHKPVRLRVDSDAALLTWDDLIKPEKDRANGAPRKQVAALHKIVPHLITVPGIEDPVVSFQSGLVRLAPTWGASHGARFAWSAVDGDIPILRARVHHKKVGDSWVTEWNDRVVDVLEGACLHSLSDVRNEPTLEGDLRCGYKIQPIKHAIGKGVGPWFHEIVAHHARQSLGSGAEPILLEACKNSWPTKAKMVPRIFLGMGQKDPKVDLDILVIYANSNTRRRVRDALIYILQKEADTEDLEGLGEFSERIQALEDETSLHVGPIKIRFVCPPDAAKWLLSPGKSDEIVTWLDEWLSSETNGEGLIAAIVETDETAAKGSKEHDDPKHVLRRALANRKIVTQFLTAASEPNENRRRKTNADIKFFDYPAANAVSDLMRSAGFFLRPFPAFGVETGTLLVGIYATQLKRNKQARRGSSYLVNMVAVEAGNRNAWGYVSGRGWLPLGEATASLIGESQGLDRNSVKPLVENAVEQLRLKFRGSSVVLLFDGYGCRRFWPCLQDKSDGKLEPWMIADNRALVRVRAIYSELVRPAGSHDWESAFSPAKHTDFRPMKVVGGEGKVPSLVISGSAIMNNIRSARNKSRYNANDRELGDEWHSLGATELMIMNPGKWEPERLVEQAAMLCRIAPTWDRVLRWPSPIHLARAVIRDRPKVIFDDAEIENEEIEDSKPMRFDF